MSGVDVKPKIKGGGGRRRGLSKPKPPVFKGLAPELEQLVFDYGVGKASADFKVYKEMVAE